MNTKDAARGVAKLRIKAMQDRLVGLVAAKEKLFGMPEAQAEVQVEINDLCKNINDYRRVWC